MTSPRGLRSVTLKTSYNTSRDDLILDFFVPLLTQSKTYDRGVGYFSSGWLKITAKGMVQFAANGGRARWVTSPILNQQDWDALMLGSNARSNLLLHDALAQNIDELQQSLENDTLSALAWMVADEILDFRLALPRNKLTGGDFHDKFGLFGDANGDKVAFNGSYNESIKGTRNYESIKVFTSWVETFEPLVNSDAQRFQFLWNNQDPNVEVYHLPDAAREKILQLRSNNRPYPEPEWIKLRALKENTLVYKSAEPIMPEHIDLRSYQNDAIEAWIANLCRGFFEMATGTGKTITALSASVRLFNREKRLAVVISVPYQHLVDQWCVESETFGYRPFLAYQSKSKWLYGLNHLILEFEGAYRNFISVITTHTTFISEDFQNTIARLNGPTLFIADEAHHLGAERSRLNYPQQISYRLALSATPERWFDEEGTQALRSYFGDTVFSFTLEEAIGVSLTPYYYHPCLVPLTDDEMDEYEALSIRIARQMGRDDDEAQERLNMLLIERSRLLNNASNKLSALSDLIDQQNSVEYSLFYCAPGQIDDAVALLGWDKGLLIHRFTAEESTNERQQLLQDFADGNLQGLVAMKCLDEGVDVPATRTAFFLASSSNPREFIQRRGRVLRKHPGKEFSTVYDLIAIPPERVSKDSSLFNTERSIVRKELHRFKEFASVALNKHQATDVIWELATYYGLMDF